MTINMPTFTYFISASVNGSSHPIKNGIIQGVYTHNASSEFTFTIKSSEKTLNDEVELGVEMEDDEETINEALMERANIIEARYDTYSTKAEADAAIEAGFTIDAAE